MPNKPETRQAELSVILPELLKSFGNNPMTVDTIDVGQTDAGW